MIGVNEMSGSTLAYMGDVVWSLYVREYLIKLGYGKAHVLQKLTVKFVSAKAQARIFHKLEEENFFNEKEMDIFKRGRNYTGGSYPKNTDVQTYRISTGFEALIGYLYLEGLSDRIDLIFEFAKKEVRL